MKPALHVVAGVLSDAKGRVLIAQRPRGTHLAGGWEFPGGKLQAGEERAVGLARELREEIGVEVRHCRPLLRLHHEYPDRDIDLDVWRVDTFSGEPQGLDGQALRWCSLADLPRAQLLPADVPVITALRLPERMTALRGDGHELLACEEFAGGGLPPRQPSGERLRGALCASLRQARTAAAGGAEFIVFTLPQPPVELAAACRLLNLPVFASGLELSAAQAAGAVGISQL
jgi:mutator protein MutT